MVRTVMSLLQAWILVAGVSAGPSSTPRSPALLPFDRTNPIIYDNDSPEDMYTDELLLALNTLKWIDLRGMITTGGGWSEGSATASELAAQAHSGRLALVAKAQRSGMRTPSAPLVGVSTELLRPKSGRIGDTSAPRSEGARFIVEQAQAAPPDQRIVVVAGGPATTIADALLIDPRVADRLVVAWAAQPGDNEFNASAAPFRWATDIVLQSTTVVLFPSTDVPTVRKRDLTRLPHTELRQFMIDKALPHVQLPGDMDGDAAPVIPLIRSDYVTRVTRQRFVRRDPDRYVVFANDPNGNIWTVTSMKGSVATDAWWRTMTDPRAWGMSRGAK